MKTGKSKDKSLDFNKNRKVYTQKKNMDEIDKFYGKEEKLNTPRNKRGFAVPKVDRKTAQDRSLRESQNLSPKPKSRMGASRQSPNRKSFLNHDEVNYIPQEELKRIANPKKELDAIIKELISKDWEKQFDACS